MTSVCQFLLVLLVAGALLATTADAIFKRRDENSFHGGNERLANAAAGHGSRVPTAAVKRPPQAMIDADRLLISELEEKTKFSSCWRSAVDALYRTCDDALATDDDRSRLAIKFTGCQLEMDGKIAEPVECPASYDTKTCVASLGADFYAVYVQFRIHANALCFHVEADSFQIRTLRTVSELDRASQQATGMLRDIGNKGAQVGETLVELRASHKDAKVSANMLHTLFQEHAEEHTENLKLLSTNAERISSGISSIRGEAEAMQVQHEKSISTINTGLVSLEQRQVAAGESAAEVSASLRSLVSFAATEMEKQHQSIEKLSTNAEAIATHAAEQREKLESSNMLIIETLEKVHGSFASFEALVFYIGVTAFSFLVSSTPRTSGARLPAVMCLVASLVLENWACRTHRATVDTLMDRWSGGGFMRTIVLLLSRDTFSAPFLTTEYHAVWCLRHTWLLGVVACFAGAALRYEHPEAMQRRIVREELAKYMAEQQGNGNGNGNGGGGALEDHPPTSPTRKRSGGGGGRKKASKNAAPADEDEEEG